MGEKEYLGTSGNDAFFEIFKKYETRVEMIDECANANLNHFWNRDKFLNFWDLGNKPYIQYYHEEKHGNAKFLLVDNLKFEKDSNLYAKHGTYDGPTKVTNLGNDIVTDFFLIQPSHDLDLTWMKPQDIFRLHDSIQYRNLKNIAVNVDNLAESSLSAFFAQYAQDVDMNLNLVVNNHKATIGPKDQIEAFRSFFEQQDAGKNYCIKHVTLDGFSNTITNIISSYLEEIGITASRRKNLTINTDSKALKLGKAADSEVTDVLGK